MLKSKLIFFIIVLLIQSNFAFSEITRYINVNHIMNKSKAGIDIIAQLNKENKTLLISFKNKEDAFKKKEAIIINQKNILKKNELEKKITLLKKEINLYNENKILKIKNLEKKKITAQAKLIDFVNIIIIDYMDQNSISLILKKDAIFVGKKELDITSEILSVVDNKIKQIDIK